MLADFPAALHERALVQRRGAITGSVPGGRSPRRSPATSARPRWPASSPSRTPSAARPRLGRDACPRAARAYGRGGQVAGADVAASAGRRPRRAHAVVGLGHRAATRAGGRVRRRRGRRGEVAGRLRARSAARARRASRRGRVHRLLSRGGAARSVAAGSGVPAPAGSGRRRPSDRAQVDTEARRRAFRTLESAITRGSRVDLELRAPPAQDRRPRSPRSSGGAAPKPRSSASASRRTPGRGA